MPDAKIITYGEAISATTDVVPDNQSVALNIQSSDGSDQIRVKTTDDAEAVTFLDDHTTGTANESPKNESSGFVGVRTDTPVAPLHIMGTGGKTAKSWDATANGSPTMIIENGSGNSKDRCVLEMNSTGSVGCKVRMHVAGTQKLDLEGTSTGGVLDGSNGTLILKASGSPAINIDTSQRVAVGSVAPINDKEFEINDGEHAVYFDIQGNTSYMVITGNANDTDQSLHIGTTQRDSLKVSKYGAAYVNYTLGSNSGWSANETNTARSAYLADTNSDLIINYGVGNVGVITLAANIDKIKFFNLPGVGSAQSFTLRIKQDASTPRTIDWSTVEFYGGTDSGSQLSGSKTLTWSGGVAHTMSTSTSQIDIVQFTAICDTANTITIYGSVIGQNFS